MILSDIDRKVIDRFNLIIQTLVYYPGDTDTDRETLMLTLAVVSEEQYSVLTSEEITEQIDEYRRMIQTGLPKNKQILM